MEFIQMRSVLLLLISVVCVAGCGGSDLKELEVAYVEGKVTLDGTALDSGRIFFYPTSDDTRSGVIGKPAQGIVASDGSYELTTYHSGDGAVVGTHRVTVMEESKETAPDADTKQIGFLKGTVTVSAGKTNTIDVNLSAPQKPQEEEDENDDD